MARVVKPAPRRSARPARRRGVVAALALAVAVAHLWVTDEVLEDRLGSGVADTRPKRIEVAFVRRLAPAVPLPIVPPVPRRRAVAAAAPAPAASAPEASLPPEPVPAVAEPEPPASAALVAEAAPEPAVDPLPAPPLPPEPAASAVAFAWPPSTRLSYTLTGNYRGPVDGQAQVEWLRTGTRYQVHLDVSIGPAFAPLLSRRLSSDGELTENGLEPRRYDEETRVAFRSPRYLTVLFEDGRVRLPGGKDVPGPPAVQDTASQFVQLTWLFTTQPALLEPGRSVDIALALPRYVDVWTYDVLSRESLMTPAGVIDAVHVKPRRAPRPGSELTAEMWIAPSLQYLPVRIVIRQDAETYVDLLITQLPLQSAPASTGR